MAFSYNGGSCIGMMGKDCVGLACDLRLGTNFLLVSQSFPKVFKMHDNLLLGLNGLGTDVQTFTMEYKVNLYNLKEEKPMKARTFANLVGNTLFERRFGGYMIVPLVAGINPDGKPVLTSYDSIGAMTDCNYAAIGESGHLFLGLLGTFWKEGMGKEELKKALAEAIERGTDRHINSGWGVCVYIISKDGIESHKVEGTSRT